MKKIVILFILIAGITGFTGCKSSNDPSTWSSTELNKWFDKHEWLNGWNVTPDSSINRRELAHYYFQNKDRWEKAFDFLKNNDLSKLEPKRYDIDDDNLYALVSEYTTKNEEDAKFEVHRKYVDIQYVIDGAEQMSVAPLSELDQVLVPYDETKDIEFVTVKKFTSYVATPDKFFIFFPSDIHRPSVKVGENKTVRKIVIKLKVN
jgi:YhcH/YjgK/YiaL family protein